MSGFKVQEEKRALAKADGGNVDLFLEVLIGNASQAKFIHEPNRPNVVRPCTPFEGPALWPLPRSTPSPQDGNGYVPDGYWPPAPAPVRSKSYPVGLPVPVGG